MMHVFLNRPGSDAIGERSAQWVRASHRTRRTPGQSMAYASCCALETLESRTLLSAVSQYHNDAPSTGQNLTEISLQPADVNYKSFGKLFSTTVDGQVYAQPLYIPSVDITAGSYQGTHNVTYVATENDSLYAIDSNNGTLLWHQSFLVGEPGLANVTAVTPVSSSDVNTSDINPIIGITGTPVIDGQYLYLAAATKQIVSGNNTSPHFVYTLYKVSLGSGTYTSTVIGDTTYNTSTSVYTYNSGPYVLDPQGQGAGEVTATINGSSQKVDYFNALRANNRSALTAYDGNVYIAFASHGDNTPYHGWILGYSESSLTPTAVFNANPNGADTGIWEGGGEIAIDPEGYMYVETGNGTFDTTMNSAGFPVYGDYGDSFIKIALDSTTSQNNQNINGWGLKVVDYFTPQNQASLSSADQDLGSGAPLVLPASVGSITIGSASAPNLLIGSGKDGTIYLINRDNMGKYNGTTDNIVQEIGGGLGGGGSFGTPAFYYDGTTARIYYGAKNDNLRAFTISNGYISTTPVITPDTFGSQGTTPSISANGDSDGIVWGIDGGTNELRAYNASNVAAGAIYSTATDSSRDSLGTAVKFTGPTVADGEVFVGTTNSLVAYGLLSPPNSPPTAPNSLMAAAVSNNQINLIWTDTASNAFGYYVEESGDNGNSWSQIATLSSNAVSYSVVGLQPNTPYTFRVRAYNSLGTSTYTNNAPATTTNNATSVNYPNGFSGQTGLMLNGAAKLNGSLLELTDGGGSEAASAFTTNIVSVQGFNTTFNFQLVNPNADGLTFTLQGVGPASLGGGGGALGYATIASSVAIKFDLYSNSGEGTDSTGLFVNGDMPTFPMTGETPVDTSIDMTSSGVNLHSGDVMHVNLAYDGATLMETVTDTNTQATFTHNYTINIPSFIGSGYGYVGFTAGTGGQTATQNIINWTYTPVAAKPYAPIYLAVTPASGTELDLTWAESYSAVTNFNILELINGTYTQIGQVNGATMAFASTALNIGGTYSYEVVASNTAGTSAAAGPVTGTTPTPPANPVNLQASNITATGVTLTWQDVANNATGYVITRQLESDNSQYVTTLSENATSFINSGLLSGRAYEYEVAAVNLAGPSAGISTEVETVPPSPTVSAPISGVDQITLNWTDAGHAVNGYNIYRGNSLGGENYTSPINGTTLVTGTTYVDTGFSATSTCYYTVEAVNTGGSSTPSNETFAAVGPVISAGAAAGLNPVTGTATALSVLGTENGSGTGLTYTWSYTGPLGVTYTGNANGTNAAQNITANFTQAGSYSFTATIADSGGLFTTSSINVTVNQTLTTVTVSPASSPVVPIGFSQQFSASAADQFGNAISSPTFGWTITGSGNSINGAGNATLGQTPGSYTVTARDGSVLGMATVIAEDFAVPAGSTLDINLGSAGPVALSASAGNITASQNGVQITLSGFTGVTVTDTASNDVFNFNGPLALPFTFVNCGSSTVNVNSGALIFAAAEGGSINLGTLSVADGSSAMMTAATTQNPTTLKVNSISLGATGTLDVTNNKVLINYGSGTDPISSISSWISSGYANGAWNAAGIISTTAQTHSNYGLGYADAADANNPAGLPSGQIEILYTLLGDANLDGAVNGTDFAILSSNFNKAASGWDAGDFNYDGAVNGADFAALAANFNQGSQIAVAASTTASAMGASTIATQATSTALAPDSNGVVSTVPSKHFIMKKPRHAGK